MAGLTCSSCKKPNTEDEALCRHCGALLIEDDATAQVKPPADPPTAAPLTKAKPPVAPGSAPDPSSADALANCPVCHADVPSSANLVCVECLEPLPRTAAPAGPQRTRREAPSALRLVFAKRVVEVSKGTLLIGRDPTSPLADLLGSLDNVSRRHATIGFEAGGRAWVRDEHSTNGTFVNDVAVRGADPTPLANGDRLRLASDVVARVELGRAGTS